MEKLRLQWNDFKENISSVFRELRKDKDFTDVTLACEDGQQIEAHKVVLATSSPFFRELLKKSNHPHPLIYMRGLRSENLVALIDFLYFGETKVLQEHFDTFIALTEELRLKGLTGCSAEAQKEVGGRITQDSSDELKQEAGDKIIQEWGHEITEESGHEITEESGHEITQQLDDEITQDLGVPVEKDDGFKSSAPVSDIESQPSKDCHDTSDAVRNDRNDVGLQDLRKRIKSMITKSKISLPARQGKMASCNVCGKQGPYSNMTRHIEANHIAGVSYVCDICGTVSR